MTNKRIAAKLREALALMNDSGKHWIKGDYEQVIDYHDDDPDLPVYGYCSVGAIRYVTGAPVEHDNKESDELLLVLAEVLPHADDPPVRSYMFLHDRVVLWNDAESREWNQVVEAFNLAATRLEQS